MAEAKWYVVHTYSGYENKVKANIEKTIENNKNLAEQILEVRVPMPRMTLVLPVPRPESSGPEVNLYLLQKLR